MPNAKILSEKQAIVVDIYPSGDVADPTGSTTEEFPLGEA